MKNEKILGNNGENLVANWLIRNGFEIIARNFSCKTGEIDIIAQKDEIVSFVEVKTRMHEYFPVALSVIPSKQHKIIKTAKFFIYKNRISDKVFRFDIATVVFNKDKFEIEYIENAFIEKRRY